jgi:asparagine synthase (glutamine-hydrolysing)
MCGLCGVIDFRENKRSNGELVRGMTATLHHRGPDDCGVFEDGPATLGHARLSIIDLSSAGHQPMTDSGARTTIAYNGEVYNFRELRAELQSSGVRFAGRSDTEVVLQAYNRWGFDSFARFAGMFALAIWDSRRQQLVLARDRFGIKPMYYAEFSWGFVFGSEIKSLLASGFVPREIGSAGLHEYMWFGNALGENTLFASVKKLPPASILVRRESGIEVSQYWSLEAVSRQSPGIKTSAREVSRLLESAVRSHLVADVPIGVFLSGGIDSSAITTFAARHYESKIDTFSAAFDFAEGNSELPMAKRLASELGTNHHELEIQARKLPETIEALVLRHDEPFADAANIPLYLLSRELGGAPKVILQGDGGDEIFGGYRRHNVFSAERLWRAMAPFARAALGLHKRDLKYHRYRRFVDAIRQPEAAMRMALMLTQDTLEGDPLSILSPRLKAVASRTNPFARYQQLARRFQGESPLQRMLYTDTSILLPDTFLEKVDKPTMSFGIEVRVPFLDNPLTDYVLGLPGNYKVRLGRKKDLLKRALRGVVPGYVLDAPKRGFAVPFENWLRGPLAAYLQAVMFDDTTRGADLFDEAALHVKIADHVSGRRNNGFLLWKALQLALWHRFYLQKAAHPRPVFSQPPFAQIP